MSNQDFIYYLSRSEIIRKPAEQSMVGASGRQRAQIDVIKDIDIITPNLTEQQKIATTLSNYDDLIENNTKRIELLEKIAKLVYEEWFVKFRFPGHEKVKMVDSELGKIPDGWGVRKIGELITLEYGKALTAKNRTPGEYPVCGSSGIIGYHNEYKIGAPGIVVGRAGNAGDIHWIDKNFWPVDSSFYVNIIDKDINLYYVYYFLKYSTIKSLISSAAVPGINRNAVYLLKTIRPSREILDLFDDKISKIFFMLDKLELKNKNLSKTRDLLLPKIISGEVDISNLDINIPGVKA